MKTIFTLILFAYTMVCSSQGAFLEFAIDPTMAVNGPYKGKVNDTNGGTFNFEAKAGIYFEENSNWAFNNARLGFGYESHNAIKYEKWSLFLEKIVNLTNDGRLTANYGLEVSTITRRDEYTSDHRDVTTSFSYGANIGIYYEIYYDGNPTGFLIGLNANGFRGETEYQQWVTGWWKENRWDGMVTLIRKF